MPPPNLFSAECFPTLTPTDFLLEKSASGATSKHLFLGKRGTKPVLCRAIKISFLRHSDYFITSAHLNTLATDFGTTMMASERSIHAHPIDDSLPDIKSNLHTNTNPFLYPYHSTSRAHRLINPLFSAFFIAIIWLLNVALLGQPIYLRSQCRAVRKEAERCKVSYDAWVEAMASTLNGKLSSMTWATARSIPDSVVAFKRSWSTYISRRDMEWSFFFLSVCIAFIG